ncbi:MAG: biotin/lipoyl-containing protein, partial [Alphaproteobacteria bacterium]
DELLAALDAFQIRGVNHNLSFLAAVLGHERFRAGRLSTEFIAEEFPDGFQATAIVAVRTVMIAVAAIAQRSCAEREMGRASDDWVVSVEGEAHILSVRANGDGFQIGSQTMETDWQPGETLFRGRIDGRPVAVQIERHGVRWRLRHGGAEIEVQVLRPHVAELAARMPVKQAPDLSRLLLSPMPGLLVKIAVEMGQEVKAGEELVVVEAMKMENVLRAERDGTVAKIHAQAGSSLVVDQVILEFE